MTDCQHKSTGSCSPKGVYLYVCCMDCSQVLNESAMGKNLRESCPGFEAEYHGGGICKHCHHGATYHFKALTERLRVALNGAAK